MASFGSENDGTEPAEDNFNVDCCGYTQRLEFDSQFPTLSDEENGNNFDGLQQYLENDRPQNDTVVASDAFETQQMEFDGEAQLLNAAEETQVINLAEETQLLCKEGEFSGTLETQLCEFDEEEDVGLPGVDVVGAVETKVLADVDDSADSDSSTRSTDKIFIRSQEETESEKVDSIHSADVNVTCSSGSLKRGFTSMRTASLRTSGLLARKKMAAKGLEIGNVCSPSEVKSTELCDGAVNQESNVGQTNEGIEGLSHESNSNLDSSMARRPVIANIDAGKQEHEGKTDNDNREEDFGQVDICSGDLARLSYVNSQEPGDSSQVNALDFVERFLISSHSVLDLDTKQPVVAYRKPNPELSAKGIQKLAKKVNVGCNLAETGVYDWVDSHEDEGGGEFLTRNKEASFSDSSGAQKSRTEPQKPKYLRQMKRRTHQKSINEEHQPINVHEKVMGLAQSEVFETLDVGVDTQMAAEAIEALSNGVTLVKDGKNAFQGEGYGGQMNNMSENSVVKQNLMRKRAHPSDLGVKSRSKQARRTSDKVGAESKISVASESHSKNAGKKVVKGKTTSRMQNNEVTSTKVKGKPCKRTFNAGDKVSKGTQERSLNGNGSIPAKKQRIEQKIDTVAPIASRTRKNMLANTASESSGDPQSKVENLRVVDGDGSGRKIIDSVSDAKEKALKLATMRDGIHSDGLTCSGENGKSMVSLQESARHSEWQSIARQRRSNRRVPSSKHFQPILSYNENNACCLPSAEKAQPECPTQGTAEKTSLSTCTTPVNCRTFINTASPVCMGDEYYKLSFKKNLERSSLMKGLDSLTPSEPRCSLSDKGLRKRRDMASVRVLFSHHLDRDIIKRQTKILARLGVPAVSSMLDATHFVADEFARTRNMLEAIAHGKPVVNHLWLESCGQAGCYIDERNYILRDAKKEKELGFSMAVSLARSSHHPLLEGRRVLITPNTKPGVEILSSLVKAVHGQAFERICRSIYKDDKLHDDQLVLSCEEDYEFCIPLLEKGAEVYSSELLLNGIVIQKLEFERHRLFFDDVKRTRSTIWLKKDGNEFCPVSRRM